MFLSDKTGQRFLKNFVHQSVREGIYNYKFPEVNAVKKIGDEGARVRKKSQSKV